MIKSLLFQCAGLLIVLGAVPAFSKPDLIVDPKVLRENWIVRTEDFTATQCDAIEGGISPGAHPIMRFSVSTPNIGDVALVVGDPNAHFVANDGLFEYAPCHQHFHFRHYAQYELIDPQTGFAWRAAKRGFCMEDSVKYLANAGTNWPRFRDCGAPGIPGNQGISPGWADLYPWQIQGQYFVLDGGDGQPPVPPGNYIIRITVNPGFIPAAGEPCRFADPLHPGVCHQLPESNYENNVTEVTVTVPDQQAVGPKPAGSVDGDFDGNGIPDLLWQDPISGLAQVWLLGGSQETSVIGAANLPASNTWRIVGVGDFNNDGHPDVVWQDPVTGAAQVSFLGGSQGNLVTGAAVLSPGNSWPIVSIADFDGDGHPDLLTQDPASGEAQIWLMGGAQGTALIGAVNVTASNTWRIVGTGDFDQDGHPDVLWQDPVLGVTQIWYLGLAPGQSKVVADFSALAASNSWRIVAIADFNKDGHPDVVWQDPASGTSQVWFLGGAGGTIITGSAALSGPNPWQITGPR